MDAINSLIIKVSFGSVISATFCTSSCVTFLIFPGTPRSVITEIAEPKLTLIIKELITNI